MESKNNFEVSVKTHALLELSSPTVSTALDCQALRHYSDFDATSESEVSDLSSVKPVLPRILQKRVKCSSEVTHGMRNCGARATRRRENDAFLSSLSMIVELDKEEVANMVWPDSITGCSAFTKLFDDDSIRIIWDTFISLSEKEQAKLLDSLRQPHNFSPPMSDDDVNGCYHDTSDPCPLDTGVTTEWCHHSTRSTTGSTKRQSSKRGHRRRKLLQAGVSFSPSSTPADLPSEIQSSCVQNMNRKTCLTNQKELRDVLPARFCSLLNSSFSTPSRNQSKKCNRRNKRGVTPLDLCLICRTERELRRVFLCRPTQSGNWEDRLRWTPTASLLSDHRSAWVDSKEFDPLRLDSFERLLVHCIAAYLGLVSYSKGSVCSGDRQLWVEARPGRPFKPPELTFLQLLQNHFSLSTTAST